MCNVTFGEPWPGPYTVVATGAQTWGIGFGIFTNDTKVLTMSDWTTTTWKAHVYSRTPLTTFAYRGSLDPTTPSRTFKWPGESLWQVCVKTVEPGNVTMLWS